jgi:hypothetical protein
MGGSGIRSEVGVAVGLCSRWEAGNLLQRACGAVGLVNCTVGECGFYADPVSSATLFDFCTGTPLRQQELPRIPLPPAPLQRARQGEIQGCQWKGAGWSMRDRFLVLLSFS